MPFPAKTSTDAILQSAGDLIRADGLTALSMRTLASRLGVRASSLYRHFPDRSAIEQNLANRAGDEVLRRMQSAVEGLSGERALFAAARAYLDYTQTEQAFYDLLMQPCLPSASTLPSQTGPSQPLWNFFVELVSATTHFPEDISGAAALWSFLHGFSVLSRSGQLGETAYRLTFARGTQALVRGLSVADAEAARSQSMS